MTEMLVDLLYNYKQLVNFKFRTKMSKYEGDMTTISAHI
jgi:hypothetical protein